MLTVPSSCVRTTFSGRLASTCQVIYHCWNAIRSTLQCESIYQSLSHGPIVVLPCLATFGHLASAGRLVCGLYLIGRYRVSWHVQTSSVDNLLTCASSDVTGVVSPRPCPSLRLSRMHRLCPAGDARPSPRQPSVCRSLTSYLPVALPGAASRCYVIIAVTRGICFLRRVGKSVGRLGPSGFLPVDVVLVRGAERCVGIRVVYSIQVSKR